MIERMSELGADRTKPGVIPLRPLGIAEILEGAVATIRKYPGLMLGVAFVVVALTELAGLVLTRTVLEDFQRVVLPQGTLTRQQALDMLADLAPVWGVTVAIGLVSRTLLSGLITVVVGRSVLGERLPGRVAWQQVRPRLVPLLGLTVLFSLLVAAAPVAGMALTLLLGGSGGTVFLIAGIVLAVWLYVRFSLATPALVLEPAGITQALRRSALLVRGAWGRTFGILLVALLITFLISSVIQMPFSAAAGTGQGGSLGLGAALLLTLGATIARMITAPFTGAVTALVYVDRRMRKENMQHALAQAARTEDD